LPHVYIDIVPTTTLHDGFDLAQRLHQQGYDLMVAAGGDGTLLSVINAAVHSDTVVTVLPLGTSNDYARNFGIHSVEDAVEVLCHGRVIDADVGRCSFYRHGSQQQAYFCSTAGVGLFAYVAQLEKYAISQKLKRLFGDGVWPLLMIVSILASSNITSQLQINDDMILTDLFLCELSKVDRVGGFLLYPQVAINNGHFDSIMVHHFSKYKLITWYTFLKTILNQMGHLHHPQVEYFATKPDLNRFGYTKPTRVEIIPDQPLPVHLNGDIMGQTPAIFEIVPTALKVLVPNF
jgi:diacylglycerol kinase (ATP)